VAEPIRSIKPAIGKLPDSYFFLARATSVDDKKKEVRPRFFFLGSLTFLFKARIKHCLHTLADLIRATKLANGMLPFSCLFLTRATSIDDNNKEVCLRHSLILLMIWASISLLN
jgi:hypothetical protein